MQRFSLLGLLRHAMTGHRHWRPFWRDVSPRPRYDALIIGGGGHGLATAYYLAKNHGMTDVAVLEKAWIGGGNTGRNTTIVRSNYLCSESAALYEHSLRLWEGLTEELNINLMFSQRGVLNLAHSLSDVREGRRRVAANGLSGIDAEWLEPEEVAAFCPVVNVAGTARHPVLGATLQRRGGVARHDSLAWGYARAADSLGVDIVQNCEVTGILRANGAVTGVRTTRGTILSERVGVVTAGHASVIASMADIRLPVQSHPLQALVSEPVKAVIPCVVMSNAVHVYVSQSDKGELVVGAGIDGYNSYAQRGSFHVVESQMAALIELFPIFSRLRMMRAWAGIVDVCPDASPIISSTPVKGLYFDCGWGTGGFKATPGSGWVFAHMIATGRAHPLAEAFSLDRFRTGALVDEHGAAAVAH